MAAASTKLEERKTIAHYGLRRETDFVAPLSVSFINPYADPGASAQRSWAGFKIRYPLDNMVEEINSNIGDERITPMRYRDIMVDNYLAAGGDLKTWRYIGVKGIINAPTITLIEQTFKQTGGDMFEAGSAEFLPSVDGFLKTAHSSPFTRGVLRLLEEYKEETGHAKIKRFVFTSTGCGGTNAELHIMIELCRPGEDGYVDESK
ncbi:hypothetical protein GGR50DRAFT_519166 [Xylaria sp. CBS 124048]|nr:hypothetical protein GGR50DRAFT_519166 [Xylaria sp. CBS 124048]